MTGIKRHRQFDLQGYNTLAVPAIAEYFCEVSTPEQLAEASDWAADNAQALTLLGGGSNVVLTGHIQGLVVHNAILGFSVADSADTEQSAGTVLVTVGAGENWHQLVRKTLDLEFFGLENLSLIPGTVGAAPVQNIGAYGVELKDRFSHLRAYDRSTRAWLTCDASYCQFDYRDSIFKREPGRFLISQVTMELSTVFEPVITYGALADLKAQAEAGVLSATEVSDQVIRLRQQKLPNPKDLPNAGSFFKNPIVSSEVYKTLQLRFPKLVAYPTEGGYKLAAGWLIDHAGFKGYRNPESGVGMHSEQALVLVNPKKASAKAILETVALIQEAIMNHYGVQLEMEPVVIG